MKEVIEIFGSVARRYALTIARLMKSRCQWVEKIERRNNKGGDEMANALKIVGGTDIADEIARLYRRGIEAWLEAGRLLRIQKDALDHGQWLPWLADNRARLGFGESVAQRLMQVAANPQLAGDLWWHDKRPGNVNGSEWFTPGEYVELARKVLGDIDVDPASCEVAQRTVQARKYYTAADNGLTKSWHGSIFLNPPYVMPDVGAFIDKLLAELDAKRTKAAIMLSHAFTENLWWQRAAAHADAICFSRKRICFLNKDGEDSTGATRGQTFMFFGRNTGRFADVFSEVGAVLRL
jgi:hypothetical protein